MFGHRFHETVSNVVDHKRYSRHKINTVRKCGKWRFQIIDYFGLIVHESKVGLTTQLEARVQGKAYRDLHHPKIT